MLVGNYDYAGTQKFRLHILRDEESDVTLCGIDTLKRKGNWEWTQSEGDKDCGCAHCNRKAAQQSMHADQKRAANSNVYLHLPLLAGDTSRWADAPPQRKVSQMDIQEIADSLQPFTPVIQWGAVSQKWHVTFADWKDDIYTGDTILLALQAAQQGLQSDAEAAYQVEKHGDWKYWQEREPSWKLPRR